MKPLELWYLKDGPCDPLQNMARDWALFDAVENGTCPGAIRVYQWARPCVSLGRHQALETSLRREACRELGLVVVRRPTGGKGVLHGADLTVSCVLPFDGVPRDNRSVCGSHRLIMGAIGSVLETLGLACVLGNEPARLNEGGGDCFSHRTKADLVYVHGPKAAGGAQARRAHSLLEQVSIPLGPALVDPSRVFLGETGPVYGPVISMEAGALGDKLAEAITTALSATLVPMLWPTPILNAAEQCALRFSVDIGIAL